MGDNNNFKIFLGSNEFLIPSNFNALGDVDQKVYSSLITNKQYIVKSQVSKEVLRSFINNWIEKETPDICSDNISEYSLLSEEFDRMKDLVLIFQKNASKREKLSLINTNIELKKAYSAKSGELSHLIKIYEHKNSLLFSNISNNLYNRLRKHNWNYIDKKDNDLPNYDELLSTSGIELQNGLIFTFNYKEKTAELLICLTNQSNVFVPKSIFFDSVEYLIKTIHPYCFDSFSGLETIQFPEDSELQIISKDSFVNTNLKSIKFPSHVTHIGNRAFKLCQDLEKVEFSDKINSIIFGRESFQCTGIKQLSLKVCEVIFTEKSFEYSKLTQISISSQKVIIGECAFSSNSNLSKFEISEETENLAIGSEAFKNTPIEFISILAKNVIIGWSVFSSCKNIKKVEFSNKSQSIIVGKYAFGFTSIESVVFPSKNTEIKERCFSDCLKLSNVEFIGDSVSIDDCSFINSGIQSLSINAKKIQLNNGWCFNTKNLVTFNISPHEGEKYLYYNNDLLFEKSNPESDKYDLLSFVRRNILNVQIPPFIRKICESALQHCVNIQKVEFIQNSELEIIDSYSFCGSSIQNVTLPSSVTKIGRLAFFECNQIKSIEFCENSKLKTIEESAFDDSSLESLSIPSSIEMIEDSFNYNTPHLVNLKVIDNGVKNIHLYDNDFIIGKSDIKSDIFDILYIARRDIKVALIPPFIKVVTKYAFEQCSNLKAVIFSEDSQIEELAESAFSRSLLRQFFIPKKLVKFGEDVFYDCNLIIVEIDENSELTSFDINMFDDSLKVIMVPVKLKNIEEYLTKYKENANDYDDDDDFDLFG